MPRRISVLIDYENFVLSRRNRFTNASRAHNEAADLATLKRVIDTQIPDEDRLVRYRAYADFVESSLETGSPRLLMGNGIEPVQTFRINDRPSTAKNAADIRMVLDASAEMHAVTPPEHFILVTGDGDFIPLVLELKRFGASITTIGVKDSVSRLLQKISSATGSIGRNS